ncbi:hypothetical protein BofuT4_P051290.1 [Botrytis cinerea T4]|uniref:Uncharacterized protein n=1 Tax=Botryotinia fuckeliana (strain T4) TaxID=999810 RepID=G2XWV2_BOTF4|nr:hypothetical protein BofuT4_P051290.1 [Botrytis cinerea T4]
MAVETEGAIVLVGGITIVIATVIDGWWRSTFHVEFNGDATTPTGFRIHASILSSTVTYPTVMTMTIVEIIHHLQTASKLQLEIHLLWQYYQIIDQERRYWVV